MITIITKMTCHVFYSIQIIVFESEGALYWQIRKRRPSVQNYTVPFGTSLTIFVVA